MTTFNYSSVTFDDLKEVFDIKRLKSKDIFKDWFDKKYDLNKDENDFVERLVDMHFQHINNYSELELVGKVIAPILNKVNFMINDKHIRDWYEVALRYEDSEVCFNGRCDFVVAKGYDSPINPYFFIQEFKQASASFPENQLLAELITAIKINQTDTIKGAYIMGQIWAFVILERVKKNSYNYYISKRYDSMDIDDLTKIYKILQNVKQELIEL